MYFRDQEDKIMRIALINENSQAGKNEIIYRELKGVVEPMGHVVDCRISLYLSNVLPKHTEKRAK